VALRIAPDIEPVDLNSEQMERVLFNLLDNAIKFSPTGGSIIAGVEECTHEGRSGVLIRVQDSGIGIPSSELIRIFDRFHQVDPSTRRRYGGMGLGLALVRSIVEAHLGVVWAESEQDLGSTFFVWLPRLDIAAQQDSGRGPSGRLKDARARELSSQEG
jgi:two-component system sensor histidine kinase VicK